jgi:hypothetical protein
MAHSETPQDEITLKIQALVDNELPESEIAEVMQTIQGSYEYRDEYVKLLRLKRRLGGQSAVSPPDGWLEKAERRISRRIGRLLSLTLFIGSYIALIGYAVYSLFCTPDVPFAIVVIVVSFVAGGAFLLGNAIADRIRESRTDRYRGIVR